MLNTSRHVDTMCVGAQQTTRERCNHRSRLRMPYGRCGRCHTNFASATPIFCSICIAGHTNSPLYHKLFDHTNFGNDPPSTDAIYIHIQIVKRFSELRTTGANFRRLYPFSTGRWLSAVSLPSRVRRTDGRQPLQTAAAGDRLRLNINSLHHRSTHGPADSRAEPSGRR